MKVSLIRFYPFEVSDYGTRLVGYAEVEVNKMMVIRGIRLFRSRFGGLFIKMPLLSQKSEIEAIELKDKELMQEVRRVIVDYYKKELVSYE
ncbi:MAG: hypothetical protein ABDH18_05415 [Aquificaceae bacterium]